MPHNFYLIAHNTNRVPQAMRALQKGANALQPDVHFWASKSQFFVYHFNPIIVTPLENYLAEVALKLDKDPTLNLSLLILDLKPPYNYELSDLYEVIRKNFQELHPEIPVLTAGNNHDALDFLQHAQGWQQKNEVIGVDERVEPEEVISAFEPLGLHYAFASGSSVFSTADHQAKIKRALSLRSQQNKLKMVYVWTVNAEDNIRLFLDLEPAIDGIMTDEVEDLLEILNERRYKEKFILAQNGHNPFK